VCALNRINRVAKPNSAVFGVLLASDVRAWKACTMAAMGEFVRQVTHRAFNGKPGCAKLVENHLHLKKSAVEALNIDEIFCKKKVGDDGARWKEERDSVKICCSAWAAFIWISDKEEKKNLDGDTRHLWGRKDRSHIQQVWKVQQVRLRELAHRRWRCGARRRREEPACVAGFLVIGNTFKVVEQGVEDMPKNSERQKPPHHERALRPSARPPPLAHAQRPLRRVKAPLALRFNQMASARVVFHTQKGRLAKS
jgi:hypothetical protein